MAHRGRESYYDAPLASIQKTSNGRYRARYRDNDLRHYYASLLISSGLDVKVVQARLRHASAKTTLDTYGHLWPDSDETTRAAISGVMTTRSQSLAANLRPSGSVVKRFPSSEVHGCYTS